MQITTKNRHPAGRGRPVRKPWRIAVTASGGRDVTDDVSLMIYPVPLDGVDISVSTVLHLTFTADDREHLDSLIRKLTCLRDRLPVGALEPTRLGATTP